MKYHKISRQIGFSYANIILSLLLGPIAIFVLTRGLSVAEYGVYSILSALLSTAVVIFDLGLSQYILAKLSGMEKKSLPKAFYSLLLFLIVFLFVVLSIYILTPLNNYTLSILKIADYPSEFSLILAMILIGASFRLFSAYLGAKKELEYQNIFSFLDKSLWMIPVIAYFLVYGKLKFLTVIFFWFLGKSFTLLLVLIAHLKETFIFIRRKEINWQEISHGLKFGIPLIPFTLGSWIVIAADRFMLSYYKDTQTVGLYTLAYSLATLVFSFGSVISNVLFPYISEGFHRKKDYMVLFNSSIKYCLMIIIPATAGILALKENIITLISGKEYLTSATIVPLLLLYPFLALISQIYLQTMLLRGKTILLGTIFALGAAINISLNIILIPLYSMKGAAISTIASYLFVALAILYFSWRTIRLNPSFVKIGRMALAAAIMGFSVDFIDPETMPAKIAIMASGAALYAILLLLFKTFSKKELDLIKSLKKRMVKEISTYMDYFF
ncbi:MAG TPA: oligosaccharide flippase family protein [Candidatus Nanoarchaeia archaeon]|nr:oligosaccharide flippase family protein [Candidatus Nanoarchaeia archaeon]